MNYVIFDIDGVLADNRHRLHHITPPHHDWDAFYATISEDSPIMPMVQLLEHLHANGTRVAIITGRPQRYELPTRKWLHRFIAVSIAQIESLPMYMRPNDNNQQDYSLKASIIDHHLGAHNIIMAFEDSPRCVEMYRRMGIWCLAAPYHDTAHEAMIDAERL